MTAGVGKRSGRRSRAPETGQETLQSILVVAFVLMPVLFAIFTFGSLIHIEIATQAAAASGARSAGSAGGFGDSQYTAVSDELDANGIDATSCTTTPSAGVVGLGEPISVTVACPQHIGIPFILEQDVTLSSTFVARGEVNR